MNGNARRKTMMLLAVSLIVLTSFVALESETDDIDAWDQWGNAFISTTSSASGKIAGTDTSSGNSPAISILNGETQYYYFFTPQAMTNTDGTPFVQISGSGVTYENVGVQRWVNIGDTKYYYHEFSVTGNAVSDGWAVIQTGRADWLAGNDAAKLNLLVLTGDHTVTFNPNGGTVDGSKTKTVTFGSTYGTLPSAHWTGHTFDGWYTSKTGGTKVTSSTEVTEKTDHTLYAHWVYSTITVNFNANGGSVSPTTKQVTQGSTFGTLPTAYSSTAGYSFKGWFTSASGGVQIKSTDTVRLDDGATLYAQYELATITVTFNGNGGWSSLDSKTYSYGQRYVDLPYAMWDGYIFDGWWTSRNGGTEITESTTVNRTTDQTLYAHWVAEETHISTTFFKNAPGSTIDVEWDSITQTVGQKFILPNNNPIVDNYAFNGWWTTATGGTQVTTNTTVQEGMTALYAHWTSTVQTITTNFDLNTSISGTATYDTITETVGQTFILPSTDPTNPINPLLDFDGWYTKRGDDGTLVTSSTIVQASMTTLYAHWTANFITVSYNANGGTVTPGLIQIIEGESVTLPTPNWQKHTFNGWYTAQTGGTKVGDAGDEYTPSSNITLYAQWTEWTFTITTSVTPEDSATITPDYSTSHVVSSSDLPLTFTLSPTPGYSFVKWTFDGSDRTTPNFTLDPNDVRLTDGSTHTLTAVLEVENNVVWWDNGYYNGRVDIAFNYPEANQNAAHTLTIPFVKYTNANDGTFIDTTYRAVIEIEYPRTAMSITIYNNNTVVASKDMVLGTWPAFVLSIDAQSSVISTYQVKSNVGSSVFSFTNYETFPATKVLDYSNVITGLAISKIIHNDTDATNHPRFQVVSTTTYLDTYGFVMTNPELNIANQFPNYDNLRLNLYSFAIYGDSITINGRTFHLSGSQITDLYYITEKDENNVERSVIATAGTPGAMNKKVTLDNIFITWENIGPTHMPAERQCSLTFVNDKLTIQMGTFQSGDMTISATGTWYFTTAIWEPHNATITTYDMDWNSFFNLDANGFLILLIGAIVVSLIAFNVFYRISLIDYVVVIGGCVIVYILIGGF